MIIKLKARSDSETKEIEINTDKYAEVTAEVTDNDKLIKSRTMRIEKKKYNENEINIWLS
jgi:hypothetical protein